MLIMKNLRELAIRYLVLSMLAVFIAAATSPGAQAAGGYKLVSKWGSEGAGNGQFKDPKGVAVDAWGNVYVADYGNNRIQKFTSDGYYLTQWGVGGSDDYSVSSPKDVDVDSLGNVYVANGLDGYVKKFSPDGVFIKSFEHQSSCAGTINTGVAVSPSNEIISAYIPSDCVEKDSSNGLYLLGWRVDNSVNDPALAGVSVGPSGNVYIADKGNNSILIFSSDGSFIKQWRTRCHGGSVSPENVAVDSDENVYATLINGGGCSDIQKYSSNGSYITDIGKGVVETPYGVTVDASGNVYLTNSYPDDRVYKFAPPRDSGDNKSSNGNSSKCRQLKRKLRKLKRKMRRVRGLKRRKLNRKIKRIKRQLKRKGCKLKGRR